MRLSQTHEQLAFQQEVESFLAQTLPDTLADKVKRGAAISRAELTEWTRALDDRGWAGPHWPVAHGGTGWSLVQRHLFDVACRAAHAPPLSGFGFNMVGPAIIRFGTPAQQREFLPRTRRGELWWCQGYSEPQAGSDLASIGTRAIRDGDDYVVNGQKIWTSAAEVADWIFCLVRTNTGVQAQKGISFLLIDLSSSGVQVEPLYAFNGKRLWNQVFFQDVRVPVVNRLGAEDAGWTVAKSLLGDERLMVSRVAENKRLLGRVREVLAAETVAAPGLTEDVASRLASLAMRLDALEMTGLRLLAAADHGDRIGAEPSMLKLLGSTLVQAFNELLFELVGHWALPRDRAGLDSPVGPAHAEYVEFMGLELVRNFDPLSAFIHAAGNVPAGRIEIHELESELVPSPAPVAFFLPPNYEESEEPFPLVVMLHGGGGDHTFLPTRMKRLFEQAWAQDVLERAVVVTPSAGLSFYLDYRDGSQRWETFVLDQVIPFARARFNVHGDAKNTVITGISMGGMGSLRMALKYPDRFAAVAALEPGISPAMSFDDIELKDRFWRSQELFEERYGKPVDRDYWKANNPANIVVSDSEVIRSSGLKIYLEVGDEDAFNLHRGTEFLHRKLFDHNISHEYRYIDGADHLGNTIPTRFMYAFSYLQQAMNPPPRDTSLAPLHRYIQQLKRQAGLQE